jgi:hypothetical protein
MDLEVILAYSRDMLAEVGSHPPTLWLEGTHRVVMAPILGFPTESEARLVMLLKLGEWLAGNGEIGKLLQVSLVAEMWYWKRPAESSQTPSRKGGLLILALDAATGTQQAVLYEIKEGMALQPGPRFQGKETQLALLPTLVAAYNRVRSGWN